MEDIRTLDTLGKIYDAALDPDLWPAALTSVARELNGDDLVLYYLEKQTRNCLFVCCGSFPQWFVDEYRDHYSSHDRGAKFIEENPHKPLYHSYQWVDESDIDRHEYYTWFEKGVGIRYRLAAVVADSPDLFGVAALQRSRRQGPTDDATNKAYLSIMPHIRRAVRISREFSVLRTKHEAGVSALDHLSVGVLLVSRSAKLVFMNKAAEIILKCQDGLRLDRDGNLRAARSDESAKLARSIDEAAATGSGAGRHAGAGHSITRPSGRRPYAVMVAPLKDRRDVLNLQPVPEAVIFITDPESHRPLRSDLLGQICNLSPAESRLAAALADGKSLNDYAEQAALSINTVRWTLKQVMAKTDCRRQSELVKLLTNLTLVLPSSTDAS